MAEVRTDSGAKRPESLTATPSTPGDASKADTRPATPGPGQGPGVAKKVEPPKSRGPEGKSRTAKRETEDKANEVGGSLHRVVDAAVVSLLRKDDAVQYDFTVSGSGTKFKLNVNTPTLFGTNGKVTVAGTEAKVNAWGATQIEGLYPEGVTSGEVIVHVDDETQFYGYAE